MGILPFFLFPQDKIFLNLLNWGFLGSAGSLTAVLLGLWKSNFVEVGNTEGKGELWRAIIGAVLGFVAGIIILSFIKGELLTGGGAVPVLKEPIEMGSKDFYLSILWAMAAGMGFEKIFNRMRKTVEGSG